MGVAQTQCMYDAGTTLDGGGVADVKASRFHHPVTTLMFWGHDPTNVVNVKLIFDGYVMYDGPLEPLERQKSIRGITLENVAMFFFSDEPMSSAYQSTVNVSRVNSTIIEIETSQGSSARSIDVCVIGVQPLRISGGMAGLAYSK